MQVFSWQQYNVHTEATDGISVKVFNFLLIRNERLQLVLFYDHQYFVIILRNAATITAHVECLENNENEREEGCLCEHVQTFKGIGVSVFCSCGSKHA